MLRKFDAFARPIEGLSKTSTVGGIITITAYSAAALLLLFQLVMYWNVETVQYLQMAKSQTFPSNLLKQYMYHSGDYQHIPAASTQQQQQQRNAWEISTRMKIPVSFHVTFPHIPCQQLELSHDEARGEQFRKIHGQGSFQKYAPSAEEMKRAGIADAVVGVEQQQQRRPDKNNNNPSLANKLLSSKFMNKMAEKARLVNACTIRGKIMIPKVGGVISIGITPEAWQQVVVFVNTGLTPDATAPKIMNVSHYIHNIEFGETFPLSHNPLHNQLNVFPNEMGLGVQHINVKLISTQYKRSGGRRREMYQISAVQHMVTPTTLAAQQSMLLPGLVMYYDFTPLAVHHLEGRENFFVFLGSLVSIVGGAFVTVGLVSRCLVGAATSVTKKKD